MTRVLYFQPIKKNRRPGLFNFNAIRVIYFQPIKKIDDPVRMIYFQPIKKINDPGCLILMQLLRKHLSNYDVTSISNINNRVIQVSFIHHGYILR